MELSKRLKYIADMIEVGSTIFDVGCDHGLLDIYLTKNKDCHCIASDISPNVLKNTTININNNGLADRIKIICSSGFDNLEITNSDIVVISGMGTKTILNILDCDKTLNINNLIIQSNNEIELLREMVIKKGFYIFNECIVEEHNKNYIIIYFKRGFKQYKKEDYLFGPIARKNITYSKYYNSLYIKNREIMKKIPKKYIIKRINYYIYLYKIKKFTSMKF